MNIWVLIAAGALALILILWLISTYNGFVRIRVKIREAESGIDVALTKRFDLLSKEIKAVKGYAKHEAELMASLTKIRACMSGSLADKQNASSIMDKTHSGIMLLAENYPQLRASENFMKLQMSMSDVEEHLQAARRAYNANVTLNNKRVKTVPSNIVAVMFGFKEQEFFTADDMKRGDVEIEF